MTIKLEEHPLNFLISKLEPDAFQCVRVAKGGDEAALMSIAISLKRIADALTVPIEHGGGTIAIKIADIANDLSNPAQWNNR